MFEGFFTSSSGTSKPARQPQASTSATISTSPGRVRNRAQAASTGYDSTTFDEDDNDDTDLMRQLGATGPMLYGSIYNDGSSTFDAKNPLSQQDKRRKGTKQPLPIEGTTDAQEKANLASRKTALMFIIIGFVVLVVIGLVEINRRNILQPYLNQPGGRLRHTDVDGLPKRGRGRLSPYNDNDTIEEDGSDAAVTSTTGYGSEDAGDGSTDQKEQEQEEQGVDDQTAADADGLLPSSSRTQNMGFFSIEQLTGRYSYPPPGCVIFSYAHMAQSMSKTESRRVCLTDSAPSVGEGGHITHVDKDTLATNGILVSPQLTSAHFSSCHVTLLNAGLVVTNDGQLSSLQYITTGSKTWIFMSLNADEATEVAVKPKTTTSLYKIGITGRVLEFTISDSKILIAEVTGKVEKSTLNRNCFVVYGKNPWDHEGSKGLMLCSSWVSGDPANVRLPNEIIKERGFDLSNYDGGKKHTNKVLGLSLFFYPLIDNLLRRCFLHPCRLGYCNPECISNNRLHRSNAGVE